MKHFAIQLFTVDNALFFNQFTKTVIVEIQILIG